MGVTPLLAAEINIYSYRQPFLIQPLTDAFTKETGIKVNVAYLRKGMIERMTAEGKRSPADVVSDDTDLEYLLLALHFPLFWIASTCSMDWLAATHMVV